MPTLTFTLADAGLGSLADQLPEVLFIPEQPSTTSTHLLTREPVLAQLKPGETDVYKVDLVGSDEALPPIRWKIRVEWGAGHSLDLLKGVSIPSSATSLQDAILATAAGAPWPPIVHGYGPPPPGLTNVLYIDRSGVRPVLYVPPGGGS